MSLPKFVIDYCNQYDNCRGCKIACVAPVGEEQFKQWITQQIDKIRDEIN